MFRSTVSKVTITQSFGLFRIKLKLEFRFSILFDELWMLVEVGRILWLFVRHFRILTEFRKVVSKSMVLHSQRTFRKSSFNRSSTYEDDDELFVSCL
jgi:hypothetical protein